MFLYHCVSVPLTGSKKSSLSLTANQTGRGRGFPLFLPVTVNWISVVLVQEDSELSVLNWLQNFPVSNSKKKTPLADRPRHLETEELRRAGQRLVLNELSGMPL